MYHTCYVQITENGSGASVYQIVTSDFVSTSRPDGPEAGPCVRSGPSSLGPEQGEQDRLADARAGEQHEQAVDAESHTARGWSAQAHDQR
jgi:hypothetical protein